MACAVHETKANPAPFPADQVTLAYERLQFPVLAGDLRSGNLERRRNALQVLNNQLGSSLSFALASEADVGAVLLHYSLQDADGEVRQGAAEALLRLCRNPNGRAHLLSVADGIQALSVALEDADQTVRTLLHRCVVELSEDVVCVTAMVPAGYVRRMVELARGVGVGGGAGGAASSGSGSMVPIDTALALQALHNLVHDMENKATVMALHVGAIRTCVDLCSSETVSVKQWAASNLAALSVGAEGKKAALKHDAIAALTPLLQHASRRVLRAAALAVANIGTLDAAKQAIVDAGALPLLVPLLRHRDLEVVLNTVKALSNACAAPGGRAFLRSSDAPQCCEELSRSSDALLAESAEVLGRLIAWSP